MDFSGTVQRIHEHSVLCRAGIGKSSNTTVNTSSSEQKLYLVSGYHT